MVASNRYLVELFKSLDQHVVGDDLLDGRDDDVQHPFAHIVLADDEGNGAESLVREYQFEPGSLLCAQDFLHQLGQDGVSAAHIDHLDERGEGADDEMRTVKIALAGEVDESRIAVVELGELPYLAVQKVLGAYPLLLAEAVGARDVGHEAFGVEVNAHEVGLLDGVGRHDGHIQLGTLHLGDERIDMLFVALDGDVGMFGTKEFHEGGVEVAGHTRNDAETQGAALFAPLGSHQLAQLFRIVENEVRLGYNLLAQRSGLDGTFGAVEDNDVDFVLQFLDETAQCCLCYTASGGGVHKMTVFIDRHNVLQLLECHS